MKKIKDIDKSGKFYNFIVLGSNKPKEEDSPKSKKIETKEFKKTKKEKFELLLDKIRENWKDFAVHGTLDFNYKTNKVELRKKPDTDGGTSVGLLREAGFNADNVKFIKPGEFLPGYINLDTGFKKGMA